MGRTLYGRRLRGLGPALCFCDREPALCAADSGGSRAESWFCLGHNVIVQHLYDEGSPIRSGHAACVRSVWRGVSVMEPL